VPGTFALELVHLANDERGPDIVFTFPWSSAKSPSGLPGSDYTEATTTGPLTGSAGNHGSMSPWTVRNTFIAWGADFKHGVTVRTPSSNVDLVPTLLALMNLDSEAELGRFDGRPLREAFADGPDEEQVPIQVRTYFVKSDDDDYRAALQLTELDSQRYIDKSWRIR
jgi:arylsulfatase A-like enzyme